MGKIIWEPSPVHEHDELPGTDHQADSIFECDCGQQYTLRVWDHAGHERRRWEATDGR